MPDKAVSRESFDENLVSVFKAIEQYFYEVK